MDAQKFRRRIDDARRSNRLNLSYAELEELPVQYIQQIKTAIPALQELDLRSNTLTSLPDELAELKTLRVLKLNYNKFNAWPSVLGLLPRLQVIELSGNQITELPPEITQLKGIKEVDLSGNQIATIAPKVVDLEELTVLNLENNMLEVLPDNIGDLKAIVKFDVSTNKLTALPPSMGNLKTLSRMDVSANSLTSIPPCMGHLKNLREFDVRYNELKEPYKAKSEQGLHKFLAFLRDEEERELQEELERLKPIGTDVGVWLEFRIKVSNDGDPHDNRCSVRTGHTITQCGNVVYVFGGTPLGTNTKVNDLYLVNQDRMEWKKVKTSGTPPPPRDNHCAVYDEVYKRLIVFGGRSQERKRLNDLHYLDLESNTWKRPGCDGIFPTPREFPSAACMDGAMLIFGGHGSGQPARNNELFFLDLHTWTWSQPPTAGTAPSPRQSSALAVDGQKLFVFGGRANFVLDDLYCLDASVSPPVWSPIPTKGRVPPPRHGAIMTAVAGKVYLYGGLDELGGTATSLFRLDSADPSKFDVDEPEGDPRAFGATGVAPPKKDTRAEWTEMETELAFSAYRICCWSNDQLTLVQVGSHTMGMVSVVEDSEPGSVAYDVFKCTGADDFQAKVLDAEALKPVNAKQMRVKHTIRTKKGNFAKNKQTVLITTSSPKERRMLEYVDNFRKNFIELYPKRRPLLLFPPNECGENKFICTTVRPSMLYYTDLYDLGRCVQFVSHFLKFELLEEPHKYPEYLPSPYTVLSWQGGDCFDFSIVLTSLLLGVGYDAYCVVGYAPKYITVCDQSQEECPILEMEAVERTKPKADEDDGQEKKKGKYSIREGTQLESSYIKDQKAKAAEESARKREADEAAAEKAAKETKAAEENEAGGEEAKPEEVDRYAGQRIHCWVMVMAGKREVPETVFIEPSTGRKYPVDKSPYEGVEFLWNHHNFWVNMQQGTIQHSNTAGISFDLMDTTKWEYVVDDIVAAAGTSEAGGEEGGDGLGGMEGLPSMSPDPGARGGESPAPGARAAASREQFHSTPPGTAGAAARTPGARASGTGEGGEGAEGGEPVPLEPLSLVPDMPPSWVPKLTIPREVFDMRCPKGVKNTLYKKASHEIFAAFGECARWDGMVEQISVYDDVARTILKERREIYARRKDKLRVRVSYPLMECVVEYFDPGSKFGLKEKTEIKGKKRVFNFYHAARLDGLVTREEDFILGTFDQRRKVVETFSNRDDRLFYRSVSYDPAPPKPAESAADRQRVGKMGRSKKKAEEPLQPIRKMTEKFMRDPGVPADSDVAKRIYYISLDQIRLLYHYGPDRITASSRLYTKDGATHFVQVDPLAEKPDSNALLEEYQKLVAMEKECVQTIREVEKETKELLDTRTKEEQGISLLEPYYDVTRIQQDESDEEEEKEAKVEHDYLSPFLPAVVGGRKLDRKECLEVRDKCLRALKDRLIERANIIQARHDEETAALAKRQANFQRDRDTLSRSEEEEYEKACEESMFRIHILEQRLKRHEELALQKYYDLDSKLRTDPRLESLTFGS